MTRQSLGDIRPSPWMRTLEAIDSIRNPQARYSMNIRKQLPDISYDTLITVILPALEKSGLSWIEQRGRVDYTIQDPALL